MDLGMARKLTAMRRALTVTAGLAGLLSLAAGLPSAAQQSGPQGPQAMAPVVAPPQPSLPRDCQNPESAPAADIALPAVTAALREHRQVKILTIGASASAGADPQSGGYQAIIESRLESSLPNTDVVIMDRGVSGELARDAAERIKSEVALEPPTLVLWQVGTRDAMARIAPDEFEETLRSTVRWLKEHDVDVVLVGLHFVRALANDQSYQAIRDTVRKVAQEEKVLRIARYELAEWMERAKAATPGSRPDEFQMTEAGYSCLAEQVARAIAAGAFGKPGRTKPAG